MNNLRDPFCHIPQSPFIFRPGSTIAMADDNNNNIEDREPRVKGKDSMRDDLTDGTEGTFFCSICDAELFRSTDQLTKPSRSTCLDFTNAVHQDALHRNEDQEPRNSIQVSCAKCRQPLGKQVINVAQEGNESKYYVITRDLVRFVHDRKKS